MYNGAHIHLYALVAIVTYHTDHENRNSSTHTHTLIVAPTLFPFLSCSLYPSLFRFLLSSPFTRTNVCAFYLVHFLCTRRTCVCVFMLFLGVGTVDHSLNDLLTVFLFLLCHPTLFSANKQQYITH